jgi:hypothetical protein
MKQLDLNNFEDFGGAEMGRRILVDDPVMRVVLVSVRDGQALPELGILPGFQTLRAAAGCRRLELASSTASPSNA